MDSEVKFTSAPEGVQKVALNSASGLTVRKLRDALNLVLPENLDRPLDICVAVFTEGEGADSRFHIVDTLSLQGWDTGHVVFFLKDSKGPTVDASKPLTMICTLNGFGPLAQQVFSYTVAVGQESGHADSEG